MTTARLVEIALTAARELGEFEGLESEGAISYARSVTPAQRDALRRVVYRKAEVAERLLLARIGA